LSKEIVSVTHDVVPGFLVILLRHTEYPSGGRGGELRKHGRYVKSKLQKTASSIVVESLDVPSEHKKRASCSPP
jgi:hypothetical protein